MKKFKLIVPSFIAIIFCMLLIAGSTFALFTSEAEADISVTSGRVKVEAYFDSNSDALQVYSAESVSDEAYALLTGEDAHLKAGVISSGNFAGNYKYAKQTRYTLDGEKTYHLFANNADNEKAGALLVNNELTLTRMTPGDRVNATLKLENKSNVNIKYRLRVFLVSGLDLYEALQIKLDGVLLQGVNKVGTWTYLETPTTEADNMTDVKVEVVLPLLTEGHNGGKLQDLSSKIKFVLEAVQGNAATTNETLNTNINVEQQAQRDETTQELTDQVIQDEDELVTVTVPAAVIQAHEVEATATTVQSLAVKVEPQTTTDATNFHITSLQTAQSYDLEVLVKTQVGEAQPTVAKYNDEQDSTATALKIQMFVGTGLKGVKLYHTYVDTDNKTKVDEFNSVASETAVLANKDFFYNEETGYITLMTNSFSEYTVAYNKDLVVETVNEQTNESTFTTYEATETQGVFTITTVDEETGAENVETVGVTLDENGKIETNESGEVVIKVQEAKIGDVYYDTFLSAVREAKSNDVVEVLTDLTYTESDMIEYSDFISGTSHALVGNKYYLTVDFNNHEVSLSGSMTMFGALIFSEIKNLKLTYNNSTRSRIVSFAAQSTLNNVTVSGDVLYTTGNGAPFITYSQDSMTLVNCVNKAYIHTSNGDSTLYDSIFIGYVMGSGTVEFTNCKNEGKIVCGKAGFLVANWSYGTNLLFKINNTVNDGIVQSTSSSYYNGNGKYNYLTSDYWDKASCISVQFNNGEVYTASTSSKWYDTLVQSPVVGKGSFVAGPIDDSLTITLNEDGTFTITPSSLENVDHYILVIGTYTSTSNGSSRTYVSETLEGLTSTLKLLSFVDSQWLAANPSALEGTMAGNKIYSLNNTSYYAIQQFETQTVGGTPKDPQMISVSAIDADGNLLASAGYIGK